MEEKKRYSNKKNWEKFRKCRFLWRCTNAVVFFTPFLTCSFFIKHKKEPAVAVPLTFSFAQLAKGKSLGRSKPATKSQIQALQHTVWIIFTISKPYWTAFYRNKMRTTRCEWVRLFISRLVQSAYSSERSRCWEITAVLRVLMIGLNDVKSYNTAKGFVNLKICTHYKKGASVK
jgi:hypothetical protein